MTTRTIAVHLFISEWESEQGIDGDWAQTVALYISFLGEYYAKKLNLDFQIQWMGATTVAGGSWKKSLLVDLSVAEKMERGFDAFLYLASVPAWAIFNELDQTNDGYVAYFDKWVFIPPKKQTVLLGYSRLLNWIEVKKATQQDWLKNFSGTFYLKKPEYALQLGYDRGLGGLLVASHELEHILSALFYGFQVRTHKGGKWAGGVCVDHLGNTVAPFTLDPPNFRWIVQRVSEQDLKQFAVGDY